jgi:putative endonuclease
LQQKSAKKNLLGKKGEEAASRYLAEKGIAIIERNFRCNIGEIDLIGLVDEYLVFVEVKSRLATNVPVNPLISLTRAKCNRLRRLGEYYRTCFNFLHKQPRFDAVGITYQDGDNFSIEHIENAF